MLRPLFAFFILQQFFSVSSAQQPSPAEQLFGNSTPGILVRTPPLPERGGAIDYTLGWDEQAPLNYAQAPASVISEAAGPVLIKNVRSGPTPADHKSYTWDTVTVKDALIEKAVYAYKTSGTGHTFLVFTFKPGGAVDSHGMELNALTFGAEGWSREPQGYNITHALAGKYPLIWLATTFESYADYTVKYKHRKIFFHNINIGHEQTVGLFRLLLARIEETNRNRENYDLFSNSCTNNPVNLLNQVLPANQRISLEVAGIMNPNASIPRYAVKKYIEKGALCPEEFFIGRDNFSSFDITKI